ncbi:tol-pal system YbgF family protein, partial [Lacinutrix iliipiscaria]
QTTVSYGKNEFRKIWGNRKSEDNWRWSGSTTPTRQLEAIDPELEAASDEELYNPEFYINLIPSDQKVIDSIGNSRNYAYYQLGLIYKEKFNEYELAKSKLQQLLNSNPEEKLILPTKYNLYKIYELLGEENEASIAKNEIITNYPDSRYAKILSNPDAANAQDQNSPESIYESLYAQFENQEYDKVLSKIDNYILAFEGEEMLPKFELLKATTIGRFYGFDAYSNAINYVALTYANKPEGQQAQNIVTNVLPKIAIKEFASDSLNGNYKVVYKFNKNNSQEITDFVKTLDEVVANVAHYKLKTSIDVYNPETTFVVVHGLKSIDGANGFAYILRDEDRLKITKPSVAISSKNYKIIQIHKNFNEYELDHQ